MNVFREEKIIMTDDNAKAAEGNSKSFINKIQEM